MHKQLQSYIAVLAMFLLWSCSSEQHYSVEADLEKDRKALHVELTLMDETQQQIRSRASEAGQEVLNENTLKTLVGFLFDKNSKTCLGVIPSVYISLDKSQATIQLENELADQIEGQNVLLTLVANSQISDWSEVKHYNDLARISQEDRFNQGQSPELFLMTATIETGKVVWKAPELALHSIAQTVKLERAAAKIRAQVEEINIKEGNITYELVGKPQIQLVNYRSKSTILKAKSTPGFEPATSEFFPLEEVSVEGKRLLTTTEPFYSYEIDWSASQNSTNPYDSEMEAYLLLKLNLKVNDLETKPYYYRIPVNYSYPTKDMSAAQLAGLHKLQRNHLYHISTKVNSLGSEQADTPLELESKIAVRPYNRVSNIDGEIYRFDYLLLKEDHVVMPAITNRLIEYESSAKVEVVIDKIQYEQYSTMGQKTDVVITDAQKIANKKISAKIVSQDEIIGGVSIKKDYIRVYSPGPTNNVPLYIHLTLRQREGSAKLSKKITIVQYPDKYVTAFTSSGFLNSYDNTKKGPQPDFRFHIHLGTTPDGVPQTNTTLYKIKVLVPQKDERVGPPFFNYSGNTDLYLKTKKDEATNQMISPEFIISSQYGLSIPLPQYDKNSNVWSRHKNKPFYSFADGYGPLYGYGAHHRYRRYSTYYYNSIQYLTNETTYNGEYGAEDRCYHYFEDEYGADSSEYWENFINADGVVASGKVDKKFKYKGRWRLPTVAELRHINKIQNKQGSVVKGLLGGDLYWTGQEGVAFSLKQNRTVRPKDNLAYVRCVFDTWYHK